MVSKKTIRITLLDYFPPSLPPKHTEKMMQTNISIFTLTWFYQLHLDKNFSHTNWSIQCSRKVYAVYVFSLIHIVFIFWKSTSLALREASRKSIWIMKQKPSHTHQTSHIS